MEEKQNTATEAFRQGYNCAQSVMLAYTGELEMDRDTLIRLGAGLGGGLGKLQRTCGAVTGGVIVIGGLFTDDYLSMESKKEAMQENIREFVYEFENQFGTSECKDLLGVDLKTEVGKREADERNLWETKCLECIRKTVEIIENQRSPGRNTQSRIP